MRLSSNLKWRIAVWGGMLFFWRMSPASIPLELLCGGRWIWFANIAFAMGVDEAFDRVFDGAMADAIWPPSQVEDQRLEFAHGNKI
jgi:hypothetical protein